MGASFNSPGKNASWVESQSFEYEVWNDSNKTLAVYYGSVQSDLALIPGRVTMILDEDGALILEYRDGTGAGDHPQQVLEDCQEIFGP